MRAWRSGGARLRLLPAAGPSAAHYLVALVGAVTLLATVGLLTPAVGGAVYGSFCTAANTCAATTIPHVAVGTCQVIAHADAVTDDAVVFSDDLGSSGRLTLSRTIDKDAVVHWFVRRDGKITSIQGSSATGSALGRAYPVGTVAAFASEARARAYLMAATHEPVERALSTGDATGALALLGPPITGLSADPHPADAYVVDGGAPDLAAQAQAATAPQVGTGWDGVDALSEVIMRPGPGGGSTLVHRLSRAAVTRLGLLAPDGWIGSSGLALVQVTADAAGRPTLLSFEAIGSLPPQLSPTGPQPAAPIAGLLTPQPFPPAPEPLAGRLTVTVDLADPTLRTAAADAAHAAGLPVLLDQGRPFTASMQGAAGHDPGTAIPQLYQLLDSGTPGTSVTINTYRPSGRPGAGPIRAIDLHGRLTYADSRPADSYTLAAGAGFVHWQTCSG